MEILKNMINYDLSSHLRELFEENSSTLHPGKSEERFDDKHFLLAKERVIAIFGSSGVGKTTIYNALQAAGLTKRYSDFEHIFYFPKRIITRPPRADNETSAENIHVSEEDFHTQVASGEILFPWKREFEGGRVEWYGFQTPQGEDKKKIMVLSANNDFIRKFPTQNSLEKETSMLKLGIYDDEENRQNKFLTRDGNETLSQGEVIKRLSDPTDFAREKSNFYLHNQNQDVNENLTREYGLPINDIAQFLGGVADWFRGNYSLSRRMGIELPSISRGLLELLKQ